MKNLGKAGYVFVRVFEVLHWLAAAFCLVVCIAMLAAPDWWMNLYSMSGEATGEVLSSSMVSWNYSGGFGLATVSGGFDLAMEIVMGAASVITAILSALVFRKIGQVIKMSRETTPFQKPVVDRVRQVGWLFIATPLVTVAASLLTYIVSWPNYSFQVDVSGIVAGVLILGLTQIFAYGVKLEDDMEGLL